MCGIGGFIKSCSVDNKFTLSIMDDLAWELEARGTDATGVYTSDGNGIIRKAPVRASKFNQWPKRLGKVSFIHTRAATQGSKKDNNNNHPVVGPKYVMVHNGMCPSIGRIAGYAYKGEVDTEIFLSHIEEYGLEKGIDGFVGSASIAICERKNPQKVWLWKWHSPLALSYVHGFGIFFASTLDILNLVMRDNFKLTNGLFTSAYTYECNDGDLIEIDLNSMMVTKKTVKPTAVETYASSTSWGGLEGYDYCGPCGYELYDEPDYFSKSKGLTNKDSAKTTNADRYNGVLRSEWVLDEGTHSYKKKGTFVTSEEFD